MSSPDPFEAVHGVSRRAVTALHVTAAAMIVGFTSFVYHPVTRPATFLLMTDEQGPVELGTFAAFVAAGVLAWRLARVLGRRGERGTGRWYATFAAFTWFAAAEEISWGQSLFDFRTPGWMWRFNEQGETNLHNIVGVMDFNSACVLAFAVLMLIGVRRGAREHTRARGVPPALAPLFVMIAVMGAIETFNDFVFLGYRPAATIGALTEIVELLGAVGCLAVVWLNGRMLRRTWVAEDATSGSRSADPLRQAA